MRIILRCTQRGQSRKGKTRNKTRKSQPYLPVLRFHKSRRHARPSDPALHPDSYRLWSRLPIAQKSRTTILPMPRVSASDQAQKGLLRGHPELFIRFANGYGSGLQPALGKAGVPAKDLPNVMSVIRPEEVNDPVSQFRDRVLPIFRAWKHQLEVEHAGVAITVCDASVGSATDYQGHVLGIECVFSNAATHDTDLVVLSVTLKHLRTTPLIASADVVWGDGCIEASVLSVPTKFSVEELESLIGRLPELFDHLQKAIRRGGRVSV